MSGTNLRLSLGAPRMSIKHLHRGSSVCHRSCTLRDANTPRIVHALRVARTHGDVATSYVPGSCTPGVLGPEAVRPLQRTPNCAPMPPGLHMRLRENACTLVCPGPLCVPWCTMHTSCALKLHFEYRVCCNDSGEFVATSHDIILRLRRNLKEQLQSKRL